MAKRSTISILLTLFFLLCSTDKVFSFSAYSEIHKYGFTALGNDISGIHYNPATLFNLSTKLSEFAFTTDKEFAFNSFYLGWYLTRSYLFSDTYSTSFNLGLGMEKFNANKNYLVSMGGTLIKSLKYGLSYKYTTFNQEKYSNFDTGILLKTLEWMFLGFAIKNLNNEFSNPVYFMLGAYFKISKKIKITTGLKLNKNMKKIDNYSIALDIDIINNFNIGGSYQNDSVAIGFGNSFNHNLENIFLTAQYDKNSKKFNRTILSYNHKFPNVFYSKELRERSRAEKSAEVRRTKKTKKEIENEQKYYINEAKYYYDEERFDDAKEMLYRVIELDKRSKYGKEAAKLLIEIKEMEN